MSTTASSDLEIAEQLESSGVNVLLGGFPKCGTTSVASWINDCEQAAVSNPKETYLLCPELQPNRQDLPSASLAECYAESRPQWVVEASTLNVYSQSLRRVVAEDTSILLILMVRDSTQAVTSWHNQMVQAEIAFSEDFHQSWEESLRLEGLDDPTGLDSITRRRNYARMFSFGYWTQQWIEALGQQRVLLLQMDELKSSPDVPRARLQRFLDPLELSQSPPVLNQFASIRYQSFYKRLRGSFLNQGFRALERRFSSWGTVRRTVKERLFRKPKQKDFSIEMTRQLDDYFADDNALLHSLLSENEKTFPAH